MIANKRGSISVFLGSTFRCTIENCRCQVRPCRTSPSPPLPCSRPGARFGDLWMSLQFMWLQSEVAVGVHLGPLWGPPGPEPAPKSIPNDPVQTSDNLGPALDRNPFRNRRLSAGSFKVFGVLFLPSLSDASQICNCGSGQKIITKRP